VKTVPPEIAFTAIQVVGFRGDLHGCNPLGNAVIFDTVLAGGKANVGASGPVPRFAYPDHDTGRFASSFKSLGVLQMT
jgi:hypothetical protein